MNRNCPSCGTAVPETANFCTICGTALKKSKKKKVKVETPAQSAPPAFFPVIILSVVFVLALVITGIYGYKYFEKQPAQDTHMHEPQQAPPMDQNQYNALKAQVDANPEGTQENIALGNFLFDNQRFAEALGYYQTALKKEPKKVNVIVDAGVCYFNLQRLNEAKNYFQRALDIDGNHANALYNFGVVSAQLGEMEAMEEAWNKLIEVAPESGPAQTARQLLEQVKAGQTGS